LLISTSLSFATLRAIAPYLGLLIFTIPIWAELTGLLVNLSSKMVGAAVKLSRMTALIDGNNIFLPSGTIFIADGCSGLRYLIISLLIGYIMALVNHYRLLQSIAVLIVAAGLGLFANWLRIYLLVLIGYLTDMETSLMKDHEMFGWVVFAVILVPSVYFAPVVRRTLPVISIPRPSLLPYFLLLIGPLLFYFSPEPNISSQPLNLQHLTNYQTTNNAVIGAQLNVEFENTRESKQINLEGNFLRVDLFTHIPNSKTEEIVPYIGRIINGNQWVSEKQQKITTTSGQAFDLEVYRRVSGQNRILITKQYIVGQHQTSSYVYAKLIQILAKAAGDNHFGLLLMQTNCEADCAKEIERISPALDKLSIVQ
jgi:exosortase/archaeosortase family protein